MCWYWRLGPSQYEMPVTAGFPAQTAMSWRHNGDKMFVTSTSFTSLQALKAVSLITCNAWIDVTNVRIYLYPSEKNIFVTGHRGFHEKKRQSLIIVIIFVSHTPGVSTMYDIREVILNSNLTKSRSSIASVVHPFWDFALITAVINPWSVQNFKTIGLLRNNLDKRVFTRFGFEMRLDGHRDDCSQWCNVWYWPYLITY